MKYLFITVACFISVSVLCQEDPLTYFNKGNDFLLAKDFQNAIYAYDKAIELDPNLYYIYATRAEAKVEMGDFRNALIDYNQYKKIVENLNLLGDPDILEKRQKLLALFPSSGGDNTNFNAESIFETDLIINSDEALKALYYRAKLKYESGDLVSAINDFGQAISHDSSFVEGWVGRGYAYLKKRELKSAYDDFGFAIFLNPNQYYALVGRGEVKDKLRNFTSAIEDFNAAIQVAPGKYNAFFDRGLSWFNQKNYAKAEEDFSTVIKLNAKHERAFFNRAVTKVNQRRSTEACLDFKMAQSLGYKLADEYVARFCR